MTAEQMDLKALRRENEKLRLRVDVLHRMLREQDERVLRLVQVLRAHGFEIPEEERE